MIEIRINIILVKTSSNSAFDRTPLKYRNIISARKILLIEF